ncbi:MAG: tRNA (adenosine(37)-N6)-threonylcarbamoyltransferase complex transferase subunit TsaD [Candidatus Pacebacteria bacterium]|nr:tRNA (adenosine(37)-N6)-threonylcarbamoyltransferase complex transferase subunit TsaD [Candidatus Paceibacterota bacterium]
MIILGIETSCDETAISVLDINGPEDIKIRANIVSSQIKLHAEFGGVVPNLAAREHMKNIGHVFETALKEAGISDFKKEIDLIAVTHGPGLGPALLVGISFAKTLAMTHDKPLVGVDHMRGHIYSNWLNEDGASKDLPILNLIVSGGHTELVLMNDYEGFEVIGETMDDAVGEAFDKVARLLGLGYPGGPEISRMAENGDAKRFPLPRPMLHSKDFNFSFSGLKTAVLYLTRDLKEKDIELDEQTKSDIAAAFQESAIDVLIKKTIQAGKENGVSGIFLSGGVSANKLLRNELKKSAEESGFKFSCPPLIYTGDNASMIALAGYFMHHKNPTNSNWESVDMQANLSF